MRVTNSRPAKLLAATLTASAALLLAAPAGAEAACRNAGLALTEARTAKVERATECLINEARTARGAGKLRSVPSLRRSSGRYASRMVARRFFSHGDGGPQRRMRAYREGSGWRVGENLAYARAQATPRKIVRQWLRSPGHRATLLQTGFRDLGVGAKPGTPRGGRRGGTFVLHVGRRG